MTKKTNEKTRKMMKKTSRTENTKMMKMTKKKITMAILELKHYPAKISEIRTVHSVLQCRSVLHRSVVTA